VAAWHCQTRFAFGRLTEGNHPQHYFAQMVRQYPAKWAEFGRRVHAELQGEPQAVAVALVGAAKERLR